MFDDLRTTLREVLTAAGGAGRRERLTAMKRALVHARLAVDDLAAGVRETRDRLAAAQADAATARRRRDLAAGIGDAETVAVADRYLAHLDARLAVLGRKLEAQEAEAALAAREVAEMSAQFRAAAAGVGDRAVDPAAPGDEALSRDDPAELRADLDALADRAGRAAREREADARLAELKRRMGR